MLHRKRLLGLLCSPLLLVAALAAFGATANAAQAVPCQVEVVTTNACGGGGGGGGGGGSGVDPLPGTPHYAIHAVWFHCIDTTGSTQIGSDETKYSFTSIDGQAVSRATWERFGNVDSGDSEYFGSGSPKELSRVGGSIAPLNLAVDAVELDSWPDSNDTIGHLDLTWSPAELTQSVPSVGMSFVQSVTFTGDSSNYVLYLTVTRVS
jgi:hypothetical protein